VRREEPQQPGDRGVTSDEGKQRGNRRGHDLDAALVTDIAQLEQAGQNDGGDRQQEREARCGLPREAEEHAGRNR
jgi:hypothetical protein